MVAQAVPLFWCGLSTRLRWPEVYAVYRLCWGYWYAAAVRHIGGLSDAGMLVVRPGRRGVGDGRNATAQAQEALRGIGSLRRRSGPRGRLLRLVGTILGITQIDYAFDLICDHSGAVPRKCSQDILTSARTLRLWQMIRS